MSTDLDTGEGLEANINVPLERATDLRAGLTVELLDGAGTVIASNPITFVAPRADNETQSVLVKATLRSVPSRSLPLWFSKDHLERERPRALT